MIYHKRSGLEVSWSFFCLPNSYLHKGVLAIKIILPLKDCVLSAFGHGHMKLPLYPAKMCGSTTNVS